MTTETTTTAASPALRRRRRVPTANEIVSEDIRRRIFEGVLKPGDRIPQDEIAHELGVSRLPVREALISLRHEGFVTVHPHRGAYVNRFDEDVVRDHFELSGYVLAYTARLATKRADAETLAEIRRLTAAAAAEADPVRLDDLATELIRALTRASGSARARLVLTTIAPMVPGSFFSTVQGAAEGFRAAAPKLYRAMAKHDQVAAAAVVERYVRANTRLVVNYLRDHGVFS